jgi:predicted nucleic acid-binding protein
MPGSFLDTNIVIHFAGGGREADRAEALLKEGGVISVQVLNEVANVCRRKLSFEWQEVAEVLAWLRASLEVVPVTLRTHELGMRLAERYQIAIYDALLLAAARLEECDSFWSEDMHDGLVIDGALTIRNPFA